MSSARASTSLRCSSSQASPARWQPHRPRQRTQTHRLRTHAVVEVDESTFDNEVVKLIDPLLKQLDEEYGEKMKIVKIDVDSNNELVEKYEVYGLPSLMMFRDGEAVSGSKREGAIGMPGIKSWLESNGFEV